LGPSHDHTVTVAQWVDGQLHLTITANAEPNAKTNAHSHGA